MTGLWLAVLAPSPAAPFHGALTSLVAGGGSPLWANEFVPQDAATAPPVITDFDAPFSFRYLAFEKTATVEAGVAHVVARTGQGGAIGCLAHLSLAELPALRERVGGVLRPR